MSVDRAMRRGQDVLCPGAILQVHVGACEGRSGAIDAQAVPRTLDAITARGYRVIDLLTLLVADLAATADKNLKEGRPDGA